jgi:hypothetical protein
MTLKTDSRSKTHRKILLVGKDKEEGIAEFILIEHPL